MKRRTFYFNDARHYYLYAFEPPMRMEDAWVPVDECAGTAVKTFAYGVERGDGLFYPSKVGRQFGDAWKPFSDIYYWRAWYNMKSLEERGTDPLAVLIYRAHYLEMEFIASLRMSAYLGMDEAFKVPQGRGLAHQEVRDHQFAVLSELANDYATDGLELDFAAAPGGAPLLIRPDDAAEYTPVLTDHVRKIAEMTHNSSKGRKVLGARVYPTEAMNLKYGLDVQTWLKEGLVDYVVPMLYLYMILDPDMPFEWLVKAAHKSDASVYGMLMPYWQDQNTGGSSIPSYATPDMMHAAAANYWARGVDGLYTWFLKWPLGDTERRILTDIGDPDLVKEAKKRYIIARRTKDSTEMGYDITLPVDIPSNEPGKRHKIPFNIADDIEGLPDRIRQVKLIITIEQLCSADQLTLLLNGKSLAGETCMRSQAADFVPYTGLKLEFELEKVRPKKGHNVLEISLDKRPEGLEGKITITNLEVLVEYGSYPSRLRISDKYLTEPK